MPGVLTSPPSRRHPLAVPPLENGAHLSSAEFMRRYEATPDVTKAELINGVVFVHMLPLRADYHGEPDGLLQGWLSFYAINTHGVRHAINTTTILSREDTPQPDGSLRILPDFGGKVVIGADGFLHGAPELIVETAASSASIDVREKRDMYRCAGVREYIVWRTEDAALDWWTLEKSRYVSLSPDAHGTICSRVFPGLWLAVPQLLADEGVKVMKVLQRGIRSAAHSAFVAELRGKAKR